MRKAKTGRKQLFRAALAIAGETQLSWAKEQGLTEQHLSLVLNGRRDSNPLVAKIDAFTREQFSKAVALVA